MAADSRKAGGRRDEAGEEARATTGNMSRHEEGAAL